jgi:hypothetical protein
MNFVSKTNIFLGTKVWKRKLSILKKRWIDITREGEGHYATPLQSRFLDIPFILKEHELFFLHLGYLLQDTLKMKENNLLSSEEADMVAAVLHILNPPDK